MQSSPLTSLPEDAILRVLVLLPPQEIVRLGQCCYQLYAITASDALWRTMLCAHHEVVLEHAFRGSCPSPLAPDSWRAHFFSFESMWMLHAKAEGRILMTIAGRVYDATDFVDLHPGLPAFLLSAAGTDATSAFTLAGHSQNAWRILREFAMPALDPYQPQARGGSSWRSVGSSRSKIDGCLPDGTPTSDPSTLTSSSHSASRISRLHWCFDILNVLLRSARGRRKLLDCISSLLSAGLVDLERIGRDPVERRAEPSDALAPKPAGNDSPGIQRMLPVQWHLSCIELTSLSKLLQRSSTPAAALIMSRRGAP